jgi:hypothetical protein
MFSKKLLSIVGLLLVGSQISKVSATCIPAFSVSCTIAPEYSCQTNEYGYYFVDDTLVKVTGETTCEKVQTSGYYKTKSNKYYYVKHDKTFSTEITPVSSEYALGKISTAGKLCVDADPDHGIDISSNNGNLYIVPNTDTILASTGSNVLVKSEEDALTFFNPTADNYVVVDTGGILGGTAGDIVAVTTALVKDETITGTEEYCVDSETRAILEKKKEFCEGGSEDHCEFYYTCTTGVCEDTTTKIKRRSGCDPTDSDTFSNCATGYHVDNSKILYDCTQNSSCTPQHNIIGYVKDIENSNNYIKCIATSNLDNGLVKNECESIPITGLKTVCNEEGAGVGALINHGTDGVSICLTDDADGHKKLVGAAATYFISSETVNTFVKTASEVEGSLVMLNTDVNDQVVLNTQEGNFIYDDSSNGLQTAGNEGILYDCAKADGEVYCKKDQTTIGYLTNADTTVPYIVCEKNGNNNKCVAAAQATLEVACSKVGDVVYSTGLKICVNNESDVLTATALSNAHYFVDASVSSSPFVKSSHTESGYFVIVDTTTTDVILRREENPKKYRYAIKNRVYFKGEDESATCQDSTTKDGVDEYYLTKESGDIAGYYKKVTA